MATIAWVDLFCGVGGVSTGVSAVPAVEVVLAVDSSPQAVACYRQNHPNHKTEEMKLGGRLKQLIKTIREAAAGRPIHLHGSPPCQKLSRCNVLTRSSVDGLQLVRWFFKLVRALEPASYSMENVPNVALERYLLRMGIPFARVDCSLHGCTQRRDRILAVSTAAMADWLGAPSNPQTVLPSQVLPHLAGERYRLQTGTDNTSVKKRLCDGTYKASGWRAIRPGECSRNLDEHTYTVTRQGLKLYDSVEQRVLRRLTVAETAAIQGFGDYDFAALATSRAMLYIANAVPPPVARRLAERVCLQHSTADNQGCIEFSRI